MQHYKIHRHSHYIAAAASSQVMSCPLYIHLVAEERAPKPLLTAAECPDGELGCADGSCLPQEYFCDGSVDCLDGSDEGWCDHVNDPNAVGACDHSQCFLPDCFCSRDGTRIPGDLERNETPQMIMLTFDDAINQDNWDLYNQVLFTGDRKNPNGCPIRVCESS